METQTRSGDKIENRVARIKERIGRVEFCLDRDKDDKAKVDSLNEEMEALEAELKFMEFKAKKPA
jgi:hypothetical protein